jgi:hypothetical protein
VAKVRARRGIWVNTRDPDKPSELIPAGTEFDPAAKGIPEENVGVLRALHSIVDVPEAKKLDAKAAEAGVDFPSPSAPRPAG